VLVTAAGHGRVDAERGQLPVKPGAGRFHHRNQNGLLEIDEIGHGIGGTNRLGVAAQQGGDLVRPDEVRLSHERVDRLLAALAVERIAGGEGILRRYKTVVPGLCHQSSRLHAQPDSR
jgi:hypothetical protein